LYIAITGDHFINILKEKDYIYNGYIKEVREHDNGAFSCFLVIIDAGYAWLLCYRREGICFFFLVLMVKNRIIHLPVQRQILPQMSIGLEKGAYYRTEAGSWTVYTKKT
jgi:hypothetical protein